MSLDPAVKARLRLYSDLGDLRQWYGPDGTANDAHTAARKDVDESGALKGGE